MVEPIKVADWLRAILLIIFACGQMLAGFLPDLLGWDVSIASRSAEFNTVLIPAGWAFLIWLPLFLGAIAFAIHHALPNQLRDPLMRKVGWLVMVAFAANTLRSIYEPLNGPNWISFIMLEAILIPLLIATLLISRDHRALRSSKWTFAAVVAQAGWITVASAAGFSQMALFEDWAVFGLSDGTSTAFAILAIWIPPALAMVWFTRLYWYAGPIAWGLFWIFFVNQARGEVALALSTIAVAVLVILTCYLARRSDRPIAAI